MNRFRGVHCPVALALAMATFVGSLACGAEPEDTPAQSVVSGDAVLRIQAGPSPLEIKTTSRLAGAIDSLTWNGKQFVDSFDHGRQIQSAVTLDLAREDEYWPERFNPTEAGSRADHTGPTTTSRLLSLRATDTTLETQVQMAFWLSPGERSSGRLALNEKKLSEHTLTKRLQLNALNEPHLIDFDITFTIPDGETHRYAQFEALTGYMPPEFSQFLTWEPRSGQVSEIDLGPGEQALPLIFCTQDRQFAMGVYSPDQPSPGYPNAGYGRFLFEQEQVVKWNCVFRVRDAARVKPGEYAFKIYVAVGTVDDVRRALKRAVQSHE